MTEHCEQWDSVIWTMMLVKCQWSSPWWGPRGRWRWRWWWDRGWPCRPYRGWWGCWPRCWPCPSWGQPPGPRSSRGESSGPKVRPSSKTLSSSSYWGQWELWYPAWKLKTGMAGLCLESAIQWYYYIALRNCQAYCSLLDSHCSNWPQSPLILSLVFMRKDWLQKCVLQCKYILWMDLKNLTYKHTVLNTGGKQSQNVRSMQWQWSWGKKMSTKVQMSPAGHFTPPDHQPPDNGRMVY